MPLGERIVTPINLGRSPIKIDHGDRRNLHQAVASNALVGILHQLASVVRLADDIFCDISEECQKVFEKTERISRKISFVEQFVKDLDAKTVTIPVGDLTKFSHCHDHHVAKHGFDCDIFTSDSRPHCIQDHYILSETSPSKIMRGADMYRKDGLCTSRLFKLWPVALNEPKISSPDFNLPRRSQNVFTFEKRYKKLKERRKTIHITCEVFPEEKKDKTKEDQQENESTEIVVPPSEIIKIDTSGTGFHRMQALRKVLARVEYEDTKKKKRRHTLSGVSDSIMQEIERFEKKRMSTSGRDHVRDYNFEDLDVIELEPPRDEEMAKYLDEIDGKIEERKEDERMLKEPKIMKFFPCRRSKSLPRCAKLNSAKALIERRSHIAGLNDSELSLNSNHSNESRHSRLSKRGSMIGNKIRSLVRSSSGNRLVEKIHKPRPKSLDLDAIDFEVPAGHSNLAKMPSMPDGMLTRKEMNMRVGPGTYYGFETESNTLPRRNVKRNEFPWESLPKDWTTSVKLREISKRHSSYTDRQSSSGHWSGCSSNRHSLDSDHVVKAETNPASTSQCSLGNDSGRDSPIPPESRCGTESTGGYTGDDTSTLAGDDNSVINAKLDTETWLKSLAVRALGREEVMSSSAETLSSLTRLTKKNIMALDLMMSSPQKRPLLLDDGECSEYSVDQEGFYTSFHNDSGLRKSNGTLVDEEEEELSLSKDSHSLCSVDSVIHNPQGAGEKFAGTKASSGKILNKVTPPAPPKRTSSCSEGGPKSPQDSSSFSDTDQEAMSSRVISKTQISNTTIPSMCLVLSDEDSSLSRQTSMEGDPSINKCSSENVADANQSQENSMTNPSQFSHFDGKGALDHSNISEDNSHFQTLPKTFHAKSKESQPYDYTKSWPRCMNKKSSEEHPKSGILKNTDRSLSGPKTPKSLNFSPVINMFNPGTPLSLQLPLMSSPTSDEDGGKESKIANLSEEGIYKLTVQEERKDLPLKYHPTLVVKPGARSQSSERKSSQEPENLPCEKDMENPPSCSSFTGNNTQTFGSHQNGAVSNQTTPDSSVTFAGARSLSSFGSINSLESAGSISLTNSLTYVTMPSSCSSPNLSNLDVPMMNTPTGSFESLSEPSTFSSTSLPNQTSNTTDNSNLSSTIETIAITTNSLDSFCETPAENRSFRTFSGPPMSTSTPHSSVSRLGNQSRIHNPPPPPPQRNKYSAATYSEPAHKVEERGRRRVRQETVVPQEPERKLKSSKSLPENVVSYTSTKYQERTRNYKPTKEVPTSNRKRGAVVNVMNLNHNGPSYQEESTNRTDSYRVATAEPTNERQSHKGFPSEQSSRTDSYRVAMADSNSCRTGSYRVAMKESLSCPSFQPKPSNPPPLTNQNSSYNGITDHYNNSPSSSNEYLLDCTRTDSYRVAVRNTQGVVNNDAVQRNSSYRVAVDEMQPFMLDSRMNGLNSGGDLASGRDSRRMGITNIDQVKEIPGNQGSKIIGGVDVSKIDTSKVVRRRQKSDVDPISVISSRDASKNANRSHKSSNKRHSNSSTYIKFDPIFELGEDMMLSMESLKTGSNSSLKMSPSDFTDHGYGFNKEPMKISVSGSQKYPSEKSSSSLIGSIKSTFKSKSSSSKQNNSANDDDWRFSMV